MLEIKEVKKGNIEELAPLFKAYRRFYKADSSDKENLEFLNNVLKKNDGRFFLAKLDEKYIGYVGLYFSYSSASAKQILILNDLFIKEEFRGQGYGKSLIDFVIDLATKEKYPQVRWCTELDNKKAQRLYDQYGKAKKTGWFHYDIKL